MTLFFRKSKSLSGGLVRMSVSKSGIGVSVGVPGLRAGINTSGRKYISTSVPGSGIYSRRSLSAPKPEEAPTNRNPSQAREGAWARIIVKGLLIVAGILVWAMVKGGRIELCSGRST